MFSVGKARPGGGIGKCSGEHGSANRKGGASRHPTASWPHHRLGNYARASCTDQITVFVKPEKKVRTASTQLVAVSIDSRSRGSELGGETGVNLKELEYGL